MNFASPICGTFPRKLRPRGAPAPTYDCGPHGRLTMAELVKRTGLRKQSLRYRLGKGMPPEKLLSPKPARLPLGPTTPVLGIACRLAASFPDTVPTVAQIQRLRPMSRAAAQRWQRAWADALEAA